jgi:hypothetical protein
MHDIIPLTEFNFALLTVNTYTKIKNKLRTNKGTEYSTELYQRSLQHWVDLEQIRKVQPIGKDPKYYASLSHGTQTIFDFYDEIIQNSLSNLNKNYDNLKSKKLFDKNKLFLYVFSELDKIIPTIELAQWEYFQTKNHNFEKDNLSKTITNGRKGIIKFCKKTLVGKSDKETRLIMNLCKKYPFRVF